MKISQPANFALFGRAEERDFIDVYFIVKNGGITMERLIELAKTKDPGLDEYYLAIAFAQSEKLPDDAVSTQSQPAQPD